MNFLRKKANAEYKIYLFKNGWSVSSCAAEPRVGSVFPVSGGSGAYLPASPPQRGCAPRGCLQSKRGIAPPSGGADPTAWSSHRGGDTQPWSTDRKNSRSSCCN